MVAALALLGATAGSSFASDTLTEPCAACHGQDGMGHGRPLIPIIAGMPAAHIEEAIYAYVDGARECVRIQEMCETVSALSEDEVTALANHYAAMPRRASAEAFDPTLAKEGEALHASRCAMCHLRPDDEDVALGLGIPLHGQRKEYIRFAIEAYMQGERLSLLDGMAEEIRVLKPGELSALVNYYASYRATE
jgi:cytochrome c553